MKLPSTTKLCTTITALVACGGNAFTAIPVTPMVTALASSIPGNDQFMYIEDASCGDLPGDGLLSEAVRDGSRKRFNQKPPTRPPRKDTGIFAPFIKLAQIVMGKDEYNSFRLSAVRSHWGLIKDFVDGHSDSRLGQYAIRSFFDMADKDSDGVIDKEELKIALKLVGFNDLNEKRLSILFDRADEGKNGTLDFDEFKATAPKILQINLINSCKINGEELGFLV